VGELGLNIKNFAARTDLGGVYGLAACSLDETTFGSFPSHPLNFLEIQAVFAGRVGNGDRRGDCSGVNAQAEVFGHDFGRHVVGGREYWARWARYAFASGRMLSAL